MATQDAKLTDTTLWPINGIAAWLRNIMPKLSQVMRLSGGWEHWAQVELAMYLWEQHNDGWDRERRVLGPGQSVDLWLDNAATKDEIGMAIELKCRLKSDFTSASFVGRYMDDFKKIGGVGGVMPAKRPAWTYVVGISAESVDTKAYPKEITLLGGTKIKLENLCYSLIKGKDLHGNDMTMYLIWWRKYWQS